MSVGDNKQYNLSQFLLFTLNDYINYIMSKILS